ncbi:hypothetical protein LCGC14_0410200 [marine sediment metagenome]|uniref:Uncharacterized protein n=1 Tax=marine sediment metagenome TaxID=412755 RepID=A0A0F9VG62_9ZZZZ
MWNEEVLCACGCATTFTEDLRVGRPREYLNFTHAKKVAMKNYRRRVKEGVQIVGDQCRRYQPKSLKIAEKVFEDHCKYNKIGHRYCPKSLPRTQNRCPAAFHKDWTCDQKLCIAYGTLLDDFLEWKIPNYRRRYTTYLGFWMNDFDKADAVNPLPTSDLQPWEEEGVYV